MKCMHVKESNMEHSFYTNADSACMLKRVELTPQYSVHHHHLTTFVSLFPLMPLDLTILIQELTTVNMLMNRLKIQLESFFLTFLILLEF